ncbi:MAG: CHAP domain-containing protein [Bacteroidetes bacterium]|nr:CHAP domain-containing protein [Bacteroidota bacterium]
MKTITSPLLTQVLIIAHHEIGVVETPPGSNSGPVVNQYLNSVKLKPGAPWCAAFVYWCFEQASTRLNRINPLPRSGSCLYHWRKTKGSRITAAEAIGNPSLIEPGCVFIINLGKGKGHMGIVVSVQDGCIHTIEGNTNTSHSANGIGVFALERKIGSITGGFIKYC